MPAQRPQQAASLEQLLQRISACRVCQDEPEGVRLPHEPRPVLRVSAAARLCVAGQAPGTRVHASGVPFTDPSGDRLRQWLAIDRDTFYDAARVAIVPMGFCFPGQDAAGGDLPPRRECAAYWHDAVYARLANLELILAIGRYAHAYHLGEVAKSGVTETVRAWRSFATRRPRVIPLPHPSWRNTAWLKRNPWFETELLPELRAAVAAVLDDALAPANVE